jgi:hypothetical protein
LYDDDAYALLSRAALIPFLMRACRMQPVKQKSQTKFPDKIPCEAQGFQCLFIAQNDNE